MQNQPFMQFWLLLYLLKLNYYYSPINKLVNILLSFSLSRRRRCENEMQGYSLLTIGFFSSEFFRWTQRPAETFTMVE